MKAKIKNEQRFTIKLEDAEGRGVEHKGCIRDSEWNGLTAFITEDGSKIIVSTPNDLQSVLSRVFDDNAELETTVVTISPMLVP